MFHSSQPQPSDGDTGPDYGGVPAVPDGSPPDASRARAYAPRESRAAPGAQRAGLRLGAFQNGRRHDHPVGPVPTEADRLMVQTQIFLVARIFSIEDHIQVRDSFRRAVAFST